MTQVVVVIARSAELRARDLAAREPVRGRGVQLFGERVLMAELSAAETDLIAQMPGVVGVYADVVPDDVDVSDDAIASIAVQAWNSRRREEEAGGKRRIGDGAAWDDPRFEPEGRPGVDDSGAGR